MNKSEFMEKEFRFWQRVTWFDLTGVRELDEDRKVVIEMVTQGYADHYTALLVRIIHKVESEIVRKLFRFEDYLWAAHKQPHPNYRKDMKLEVIGPCGWEWYIAVPSSTAPLVDSIELWIGMFT